MIYKFDTRTCGGANGYLEINTNKGIIQLALGDYEEDSLGHVIHYLEPEEVDDVIISLTEIKNRIQRNKDKS